MSMGGIIGKNLNIDLTNRTTEMEYPSEWLYKNMLGGYGIGAYIVYQRQKAFADEEIYYINRKGLSGIP